MKRLQNMTIEELRAVPRDRMLDELYKMAKQVAKKFDHEKYHKMWTMCSDWNTANGTEELEIFMCEGEDGEGNEVFYIEDDYFHYGI